MTWIKRILKWFGVFAYGVALFLFFLSTTKVVMGQLPFTIFDKYYFVILVFPLIFFAPFIFITLKSRNKSKKKFSKSFLILWSMLITVVISTSILYLNNYRPKLIRDYCNKQAKLEAKNETSKKGYNNPNEATYFVIYELTKEGALETCLFQNGMTDKGPSGWNFDWLPNK